MTTVKPGTRCECRKAIPADAVRLVTIGYNWIGHDTLAGPTPDGYATHETVPMCEPCATFHEQKGA